MGSKFYDLNKLESKDVIRKRCIGLAAIDIIFNEKDWLRVHAWKADWHEEAELASVDNGAGDNLFIIFTKEGCIIKGFDHESFFSPHAREKFAVWEGIYEQVPQSLIKWLEDEAIEEEDVTFCIWQEEGKSWERGDIKNPEDKEDGSKFLLGYIQKDIEEYIDWLFHYYSLEKEPPRQIILDILDNKPITTEMIEAINPDRDVEQALAELKKYNILMSN